MSSEGCPACGTRRVGAFKYCLRCGLDYDALTPVAATATDAAPSRPIRETHDTNIVIRLASLAFACVIAAVAIVTVDVTILPALRIALAVSMVFILPGYALVSAIIPARRLSIGEQLLASSGMSLAIATCTAILLGISPMGLSRASFAVALGVATLTLSAVACWRSLAELRRHRMGFEDDEPGMAAGGAGQARADASPLSADKVPS